MPLLPSKFANRSLFVSTCRRWIVSMPVFMSRALFRVRHAQSRVCATIGVTRGFGDHDLKAQNTSVNIKPFLSSQPEVRLTETGTGGAQRNDPDEYTYSFVRTSLAVSGHLLLSRKCVLSSLLPIFRCFLTEGWYADAAGCRCFGLQCFNYLYIT